jgi:RNA polymerase sigma-70 factor (ECF subfamily)
MPSKDRLEAWVESYGREIHAYLWRMLGDLQEAEDCLQETYLRAWKAPDRGAIHNPRAWLYAVAGNVARSELRRRARESDRQAKLGPDTGDGRRLPEQVAAIRQAVERLPQRQREALLLRRYQGLSYAEIAAVTGGSAEAARANVYQAMQKLRRELPEGAA